MLLHAFQGHSVGLLYQLPVQSFQLQLNLVPAFLISFVVVLGFLLQVLYDETVVFKVPQSFLMKASEGQLILVHLFDGFELVLEFLAHNGSADTLGLENVVVSTFILVVLAASVDHEQIAEDEKQLDLGQNRFGGVFFGGQFG